MGLWRDTKYFFRRIKRINNLENSFRMETVVIDPPHKLYFPETNNPLVSIIIPFFNQETYTLNCLLSICNHLPEASFEILLVDDASTEVMDFSGIENIRIIRNTQNKGFLRSVNVAIAEAKGEFVYLLNNDTSVKSGFLDELLYVFRNFDNVGAVGSMLLNADGSLQEAGCVFMQNCRISQVVGKKKSYYPEFNYIYKVDYCSGCSLMFRKYNDAGELNLFDEQFAPAYFEETDLCFNFRYHQGKEVYFTPFSKVVHFNGVSYNSEIALTAKKQDLFDKNLRLFKSKWQKQIEIIKAKKPQTRILELNENKSIVFYNGVVPEYDTNSGELRLTELIKSFRERNYFVAIVADKNRIENPYNTYFQRLGVCVFYEHLRLDNKSKFLKRLRLSKPLVWFYAVQIFLKNFRAVQSVYSDAKLIYDMVDIHHLRYERAMKLEVGRFSHKKNYWKFLRKEKYSAKKADLVVAISDDEKKYMEKFVNEAKIITISNIHYIKKNISDVPGFSEREGILFVGSIHPPNIDAVNFLLNDIMPFVWEFDKTVKVNIVGNVNDMMATIDHRNVVFHGYVHDMESFLLKSKLMVAPLRYGAGVKGKIGQSFEYFLPVVTSSIGAEGMHLEDGYNALIADDKEIIAQKILQLLKDKALWEKLQMNSEKSLLPFSKEMLQYKIQLIENFFHHD